jgi:hypothetical protein
MLFFMTGLKVITTVSGEPSSGEASFEEIVAAKLISRLELGLELELALGLGLEFECNSNANSNPNTNPNPNLYLNPNSSLNPNPNPKPCQGNLPILILMLDAWLASHRCCFFSIERRTLLELELELG